MQDKQGVFISYARKDGEGFATKLLERLRHEEGEIPIWMDRIGLEGGKNWRNQIIEAIEGAEYLVLVMTPGAMTSENVKWEWLRARQEGVCVCPVLGDDESKLDFKTLPRWMSKIQFYDTKRQWKKFVHRLHSPYEAMRVPFMAPDLPERFVQRPQEFDQLIDLLLDKERQNPVGITTGLHGAGGFGKTTLAAALCHNDEVINNFDDGILWVTLGEQRKVLDGLTKLYNAMTGKRPDFVDEEDAADGLANVLQAKDCLIVVDDVWNPAHLRHFLFRRDRCAYLITTRFFDIVSDYEHISVDEMLLSEATKMLIAQSDVQPDDTMPFEKLADRLGEWPLLIELAGSALRRRMKLGDSLKGAIGYLNKAFDKHGVVAFDWKNATERDQAAAISIEASLGLLAPGERERYTELAIFPEDTDVPLGVVRDLWGTDQLDTEEIATDLAGLSLLKLDLASKTMRLHDVLRHYICGELKDAAATHGRLIDTWGDLRLFPYDYAWLWIAHHLMAANRKETLRQLLLDFVWIKGKVKTSGPAGLLADYDYFRDDKDLRLIQGAIRLAGAWAGDEQQLRTQLYERLMTQKSEDIQNLLARLPDGCWLRPMTASLEPPGGPLRCSLRGHTASVNAVVVIPDGKHAISASSDRTLKVWDLETGQEGFTLKAHTAWVMSVAVTPDGKEAISASSDNTLKVWDLKTAQERLTLKGHTDPIYAVMVTPDGKETISASFDDTLKVWDLTTGQERLTLKGHTHSVWAVVVTPDGKEAISASVDNTLKVWDLKTGHERITLKGHTDSVHSVAVTPDGKEAVSASQDGTLKLWDLTTGQECFTLNGHTSTVTAVAVMPDGKHAISVSGDNTLKVWHLETGQERFTFKGHKKDVTAVVVTPDGKNLISASRDQTLKVWDLTTGHVVLTLTGHTNSVNGVAVTPDGKRAISASDDNMLKVWDLTIGQKRLTPTGHTSSVNAVVVTPDGKHAISASGDNTLKVWGLSDGHEVLMLNGHTSSVDAVAVTPDGKHAISASNDDTIKVWDLETGKERFTFKGHTNGVMAVVVTPNGKDLVSASRDQNLKVWNLETDQECFTLKGHTDSVIAVAVTSNGRRAISVSSDKTVKVWDLEAGQERLSLKGHTNTVCAVVVTPDGKRAISAGYDKTLKVWNLETGQEDFTLKGHTDCVRAVVLTPDGKRAISAAYHHTLRVWDLSDGHEALTLTGHTDWVNAVAVTPDGKHAISASDDHTLRVWDIADGQVLATFGGDGEIRCCAEASDGKTIVAGEESGRVHFLRLEGV